MVYFLFFCGTMLVLVSLLMAKKEKSSSKGIQEGITEANIEEMDNDDENKTEKVTEIKVKENLTTSHKEMASDKINNNIAAERTMLLDLKQENNSNVIDFGDYFSREIAAGGSHLDESTLYYLKEKVEDQLSELGQQRELVTHLMVKVEKKLDAYENQLASIKYKEDVEESEEAKRSNTGNDIMYIREEVYRLHSGGMKTTDIAVETGLGKGEVELIIGLKK